MEGFGRERRVPLITMEQLREKVDFNPATGVFTWRPGTGKRWRGIKVGTPAGSARDRRGYRYLRIDGVEIMAHRLAWLYHYGEWPKGILRFNDGNVSNCAISNLRDTAVTPPMDAKHNWRTKEGRAAQRKEYAVVAAGRIRESGLIRNFGLTLEQYNKMHDAQDGKCAICNNPETITRNGKVRMLAVDHCHDSGKVRGLLCGNCNPMIGYAKDKIEVLERAIVYLRSNSGDS